MTRERKIILLVGAFLLLAGAAYRFWPLMSFGAEDGVSAEKQWERYRRYQSQAARKEGLEAEWVALNRALARAEGSLLAGDTPSLAGVDLQNILTEVARRSGIEIRSMRVVPDRNPQRVYSLAKVQIQLEAKIDALGEFLYRLAASRKLIRVAEARFRVSGRQLGEPIRANLTVEGVMAGAKS
jgi:type II secretory pathway component PulM